MDQHIAEHGREVKNAFPCALSECKLAFDNGVLLREHEAMDHMVGSLILRCPKCSYATGTPHWMDNHMSLTHNPNGYKEKCKLRWFKGDSS